MQSPCSLHDSSTKNSCMGRLDSVRNRIRESGLENSDPDPDPTCVTNLF